jgi:hypothetical protein
MLNTAVWRADLMDTMTKVEIVERLKLTDAEATKLDAFVSRFDMARDSGSVNELRAIVANADYEALAEKRDLAIAFKCVIEDCDGVASLKAFANSLVLLTRDSLSMKRRGVQNDSIAKARIDTWKRTSTSLSSACARSRTHLINRRK